MNLVCRRLITNIFMLAIILNTKFELGCLQSFPKIIHTPKRLHCFIGYDSTVFFVALLLEQIIERTSARVFVGINSVRIWYWLIF